MNSKQAGKTASSRVSAMLRLKMQANLGCMSRRRKNLPATAQMPTHGIEIKSKIKAAYTMALS